MLVIGLTGSIGMGKTLAARHLKALGLPVHDSDATVHRLIGPLGDAVARVAAAFPGVQQDGAIDRRKLGQRVFGDPEALARLEAILHPLVRREALAFLARQRARRRPAAVLDIPLLFETGAEELCDHVILVSAPARVQRDRVMKRPGMTEKKFHAILAQQMSDGEKRRRADSLVLTGLGKRDSLRQLVRALRTLGL
jgi:dephospho-CoA kinase